MLSNRVGSPPPPEAFRPAGRVLSASFATPPAIRKKRYTGRRLEGVRYEKKVQEYLEHFYGERYIPSPWLRFFPAGDGARWRWCQPDGILLDIPRGRITIVEVKYQHTSDAWYQVRMLYEPVLRVMFPEKWWTFDYCEVVKWYDPDTIFPEKIVLAQEVSIRHPAFKVHIWRP
jgi:hypothetical protein